MNLVSGSTGTAAPQAWSFGGDRPLRGLFLPAAADRALLEKARETVVAKWAQRCSAQCVADFNATIGKKTGLVAKK